MRALFLLLIMANLLFLAYAYVAREGVNAESQVSQLQMSPEKIKLLKAAGQPVTENLKASPGKPIPPALPAALAPIPTACVEWGLFAGPTVARAEAALTKLGLPEGKIERAVADASGYWVYMPPLKTKPETDKKIAELKKLNVTEFFVVQDAGQWKNAISLGIFRTAEAAQAYLAKLKDQGVRSAVATRRENFLKQMAFYVREPDEATVARVTELQREFPGSEVKAGACPAPAVAAKG